MAPTTTCLLTLLIIGCALSYRFNESETDIVQVHTIFRHGERTTYQFYPNDPHKNNTFYPIGLGGLTNKGKMGEFELGKFLRKEYGKFLGDVYSDDILEVRSTGTVRTIMSAQLVLAGLFPPTKEQLWHPELMWQPIPIYSKLKPEEDLIHPECAEKLRILKNLPNLPEVRDIYIEPYQKLFKYIEERSGMQIRNVHDLVEFYFIVNTEDDLNMTLPGWVRDIYPEPLYSTSSLIYSYHNYDERVKKINAGYLLKKIIEDSLGKINSIDKFADKKMYMYSGHETTLGFMMQALRVMKPHIPSYGSALLFELHKNKLNDYFVKIRYRNSPTATEAVNLNIPGCAELCPVQQFMALQKNLLPTLSISEACVSA